MYSNPTIYFLDKGNDAVTWNTSAAKTVAILGAPPIISSLQFSSLYIGETRIKMSLNMILPTGLFTNAKLHLSFPPEFHVDNEYALAGVSVNGKPFKGELQIRSSPALQISWRNNDLHVYPSDILHIQMYGIENSGNPAGKKIIVDVTGDDGITSIVTESAELELPTFTCFGFCVSCENDGSCTRCSDGKSVGPDGSCIERRPIGYTDIVKSDGTSMPTLFSIFMRCLLFWTLQSMFTRFIFIFWYLPILYSELQNLFLAINL